MNNLSDPGQPLAVRLDSTDLARPMVRIDTCIFRSFLHMFNHCLSFHYFAKRVSVSSMSKKKKNASTYLGFIVSAKQLHSIIG